MRRLITVQPYDKTAFPVGVPDNTTPLDLAVRIMNLRPDGVASVHLEKAIVWRDSDGKLWLSGEHTWRGHELTPPNPNKPTWKQRWTWALSLLHPVDPFERAEKVTE